MQNQQSVQLFDFNSSQIRVVELEGNPWFVAKDVCAILGLVSVAYAYQRLDDSERRNVGRTHLGLPGGKPMKIISESGLYKLVMRSDKKEAKAFQDWVTKVVLPAIRKDGAYIKGEEKVATGEMNEDEFVLKAFGILQRKVERLSFENKQLQERVDTLDVAMYGREVLGAYLAHGVKVKLGQRAAAYSRSEGIEIKVRTRTLECGREVRAYLYNRQALDYAAEAMGLFIKH